MKVINTNNRMMRTAARGFSLIELMAVVVIVAVLMAIAFGAYQQYVVKTFRNSAKACMSEYAQFMERWYTTNMNYIVVIPGGGTLSCNTEAGLDDRYTIAFVSDATTYTITARPTPRQNDSICGELTLNNAGTKTSNNNDDCW